MDNKKYVGRILEVKIDREFGSKHPDYGFIYPINYGYVPNTISGDSEELDCYILGVFEPLKTSIPTKKHEQIEALVEFQEHFFKHIIIRWTLAL